MGVAVRMPLPRRFTVDEYLTIERKAETKSEFHQGEIFAMAGGMPDHNTIAPNISSALAPQLRGRGCRIFNSDQRIEVSGGEAVYYPDVSVICGEAKFSARRRDVIRNPVLVVEVLSRSTARYDRLVKVPLYQRTSSIEHILLVAQDRAHAELFSRQSGKWKTTIYSGPSAVIDLAHLGCTLPLLDVYANIEI